MEHLPHQAELLKGQCRHSFRVLISRNASFSQTLSIGSFDQFDLPQLTLKIIHPLHFTATMMA
jgi:hypothetical protein